MGRTPVAFVVTIIYSRGFFFFTIATKEISRVSKFLITIQNTSKRLNRRFLSKRLNRQPCKGLNRRSLKTDAGFVF